MHFDRRKSPVVSPAEMRTAEEAAFARGLSAESLMDEAAAGIAAAVSKFFPRAGHCIVFAGKGNNAGDAFAAARLLQERGWTIELRLAFPAKDCGALAQKKLQSIATAETSAAPFKTATPRRASRHTVILDGLLGLGAHPPLRDPIQKECREINRLRREERVFVFAIDLPTGLDGDSGAADVDCVVADFTLTVGCAKRGLVADDALHFVGRLEVIPLESLAPPAAGDAIAATPETLRALLPRRDFGAYKNQFGRVGIVAGSRGLTGAATLCSSGALRAGAGLVELFVREEIYEIVASAAPPEVMVRPFDSYAALLDENIDVWAIGPGLGQKDAGDVLRLIEETPKPMVIDADALNILAQDTGRLARSAGPRLLTPHPGEMKRLTGGANEARANLAQKFCAEYPITLLLKGSRTIVAEHARALSYNTTGNPGMATGGMGDVLTGVCAGFMAQHLPPYDAARLGAWLCGRAAEIAIFAGNASEQSLLPSDLLAQIGFAFQDLQAGA